MGELSIKIKIANRVYPLTVDSSEEEGIRKAADNINAAVEEFEKMYSVKDKQDLIAMVALKIATDNFELHNKGVITNVDVEQDLTKIEQMFDQVL